MTRNKKGISAVVATILIVLLAVMAVVIVWAVLKSAIVKTAKSVSTNCLEVELSIPSADCTPDTGSIKVTLDSGTINKLKVIFYDANGDSIENPQEITDVPQELGTKTYDINTLLADGVSYLEFPIDALGEKAATSVNVAGVIVVDDVEKTCTPTGQAKPC